MSELIDLTGKKFGRLTVLHKCQSHTMPCGHALTKWTCVCECGNTIDVIGSSLKRGMTKSCGCLKKENKSNYKHGMSHTKLHQKWLSMKDRCFCKSDTEYENYGGRGITVCDEWLGKHGAENFIKWAYENGWNEEKDSRELTIDRIDVNGNYCPENCRLVGNDIQANNKTNTLYVTYNGETISFSELCKKHGLNYHTSYNRYLSGYSIEEILNTPKHKNSGKRRKIAKINSESREVICIYNSATEAAEENGLSSGSLVIRVCQGKRKHAGGYIWKYYEDVYGG